jgi:hypothetical protein
MQSITMAYQPGEERNPVVEKMVLESLIRQPGVFSKGDFIQLCQNNHRFFVRGLDYYLSFFDGQTKTDLTWKELMDKRERLGTVAFVTYLNEDRISMTINKPYQPTLAEKLMAAGLMLLMFTTVCFFERRESLKA